MKTIYKNFKRQYEWFRNTQWGETKLHTSSKQIAFRWRGRTDQHTLTSGLDDYPRASPPHPGELHVDLISWIGFYASTLKEVANFLEYDKDVEQLGLEHAEILKSIQGIIK